ncbi:MFS transporter [Sphingomonas sp. GC_Shp_3]|uniref:MFS transporter n=1 Tax=Sphingomonas sp. GC_Shp_3 TaxID=2937383 RepID=UPI00226A3FF4|nr:MFS transporter [Sphingomonas sp. GC_Shp_3]
MSSWVTGEEPVLGTGIEALTPERRRLAFACVLLAFVLDLVDTTIVNTALPAIQANLHAGAPATQWVVTGYFLTFAVLLVAGGRLGDLYGYRRLFLIGVFGFTLSSVACGSSETPFALVLCRAVQGASAAMMAPQVIALIQLMYSPLERVSRMAVFGLVGGLAAIAGPVLGGLLIQSDVGGLGWRLIFLINGPIGLAALVAGWRLLPEGRSPHPLKLDPLGTLLLAAALLALLVPLISGEAAGWPLRAVALLASCVPLMALFWRHSVARTRRFGSALIAPELLRIRSFALGLSMTLLFSAATTGLLLALSMTLQRGLHYSPLQVALLHMPFGFGVMAGVAAIGPRALPRLGRLLPAGGALVMAAGTGALAVAILQTAPAPLPLAGALFVAGIGMGCVTGPLGPITLARVDRGHAGVAGGMHNGVQQIGGALGSACVGSLFFASLRAGSATTAFAPTALLIALLLGGVSAVAMLLPRQVFAPED